MKSLAELDAFLSRPDIGTVTVDRAPNNKTYVTVYVRRREGSTAINQWADSVSEGLIAISAQIAAEPAPEPAPEPADDLFGDLL